MQRHNENQTTDMASNTCNVQLSFPTINSFNFTSTKCSTITFHYLIALNAMH